MTTQPAMTAELLPCPFCGHVGVTMTEGSTFRWRILECAGCGATTGEVRHNTVADDQVAAEEATRAEAIAAWNTRAAPSPPDGWKLVPIEPTAEMIEAGHAEYERAMLGNRNDVSAAFRRRWAAMLAASPEPPK